MDILESVLDIIVRQAKQLLGIISQYNGEMRAQAIAVRSRSGDIKLFRNL